MKEILQKIVSVFMALVVLFSTMSFSVDMHFCGDEMVDFSFSKKKASCLMKAKMAQSSKSCTMMVMEMDMKCCSDVEVVFEGQENLKISFDQFSVNHQAFIASFVYSYISLFDSPDENVIPFKDYSPPPLIREVQILDQTFLI